MDELRIWKATASILKASAAIVIAIGVVSGGAWWVFEPRITGFLDARDRPVLDRLDKVEAGLNALLESTNGRLQVVEFQGRGLVEPEGPYRPGETVTIHFRLRRNVTCPTDVEVRFYSANLNAIDTRLTYTIEATRAQVTSGFIDFPVTVRLPENMPDGFYSYAPALHPSGCNGFGTVYPLMSDFFEVRNG